MLTTPLLPAATEILMQGKQRFDERYLASLMSQSQGNNNSSANDPRLDYLAQLGDMIMRLQQPQQQQQGGSGSLNLGSANITQGFDQGWLGKRISAGSAEGAGLGGGGGKGGSKGKPSEEDSGDTAPDEDPEYDASKYGGFWGGTKDFFGWGKGNKFGFGR